jgi:hypothetical protein
MDRDRFEYICDKSEEGRENIFVNNPSTGEGGEVIACREGGFLVRTSEGQERSWDFRDCEETLSRREIFPYR